MQTKDLHYRKCHGEVRSADLNAAIEWREARLPELRRLYPDENDWYNGDESSLFFRALPDRGFVVGKRKAVGGKKAKDRLSILLTMNMTGTVKCQGQAFFLNRKYL